MSDYELIAKNSANKALAESAGVADELKAVGSLGYLNDKILPAEYIPNLLQDPGFKYFTLSGGSSINVTYRIAKNLPEEMVNMNAASSYTVTKEDYQEAYGSEEDYAEFLAHGDGSRQYPRHPQEQLPRCSGRRVCACEL